MINSNTVIYFGNWGVAKRNINKILVEMIERNSDHKLKAFIDVVNEITECIILDSVLFRLGANRRVEKHKKSVAFVRYVLNLFRIYDERGFLIKPNTFIDSVESAVETLVRCFIIKDPDVKLDRATLDLISTVAAKIDAVIDPEMDTHIEPLIGTINPWIVYAVHLETYSGILVIYHLDDFRILDWYFNNQATEDEITQVERSLGNGYFTDHVKAAVLSDEISVEATKKWIAKVKKVDELDQLITSVNHDSQSVGEV